MQLKLPTSRRGFLAGAAASALAPQAFADTGDLSFLVIGDWGERTPYQRPVAQAMGRVGADIGNAFVVSTGDNFYGAGVESTTDPQWQRTFEDVYTAPALQRPWYVVLGNHDYMGSPGAEVEYTRISPRWRMPSRYWSQTATLADGSEAAFFFIDTTPITHLLGLRDEVPQADLGARDQIMWLERELASCSAPWRIVVGHHPVYSSGAHGGSRGMYEHVRPLLQRYGVQAYFNGHDHDLEHLEAEGVNYICSGSGSEVRPVASAPQSRFVLTRPGFVACTLTPASLEIRFFGHDSASYYQASISRG